MSVRLAAAMAPAILVAASANAGDWPQFRGPGGLGVADETSLPTEWSQDANIAWKIKVPGVGWSSPIVWGDRVYVTTAVAENQPKPNAGGAGRRGPDGGEGRHDRGRGTPREQEDRPDDPAANESLGERSAEPSDRPPQRRPGGGRGGAGGFGRNAPPSSLYKWEVRCLDRATGETIWASLAAERRPAIPTHRANTYASETPCTDGERIYAYFGMTGLFCFDIDGNLLWEKDLGVFPMTMGWGAGSSPLLVDGRVLIQCDNEEKSFLVAIDARTGDELWRDERDERSTWSTPFLWTNKLRTEVVTGGSKRIRSYDPADGTVLWEMSGISGRCAATPVGDLEMVYFGTGGGMGVGPLVAVKAGASGEFSLDSAKAGDGPIAWVSPRGGPPMASPLLYQGRLYVLDQRGGIVTCYDAKTGEVAYRERIPGASGFTASPWAADGKVYCLDGDGVAFVLQAGPEFKLLGRNPLDEMCWSTPALAEGALFLRTADHLYCIRR
jgi:outer membrane protein assembly factor BamB